MAKRHRIAVIAGDGIGPEVVAEGVKALNAAAALDGTFAFEFVHFPWGCTHYVETGRMMPPDALETLKGFDAIFLGAVGRPDVPDHISLRDLLLAIPANSMILAPGNLRFKDFLRPGLALSAVAFVLSMILLPLLYPFFR